MWKRAARWVVVLVSLVPCAGAVRADIVTEWNVAATTATMSLGSLGQARALAMGHGAQFEALNALEARYAPYSRELKAPADASPDAAASAAIHAVLLALVPAQKATLDETLAATLAKIPDGPARSAGVTFGQEIAQAILADRSKDGFAGKAEHPPGSRAGQWRPTPPANAPMIAAHAADVRPFTTRGFDFLRVKGPPALDSPAYARDLDEVRRLGSRTSKERSTDQTVAAIFWYVNTPVPWQAAARALAQALSMDRLDSARMFALMNMAGADAYFAAWQIKRRFNFWRPVTAIREAAQGGDPAWEPLLFTPPIPDYPSGHTTHSGAMAQTLRRITGRDQIAFTAVLPLAPGGLPRSWSALSAAEQDVVGARIWAGIHFRTADEDGLAIGKAIADHAVESTMVPIARIMPASSPAK